MLFGREPQGIRVAAGPGETAILVREDAAAGERSMLPTRARLEASGTRQLDDGVVWENGSAPRAAPIGSLPRLPTRDPPAADVACSECSWWPGPRGGVLELA